MVGIVGMCLIVIAWAYQAYYSLSTRPVIQKNFILLYVTGSALLVVNGIMTGVTPVTMLNGAIALLATLVIIRSNEAGIKAAKPAKKSRRK